MLAELEIIKNESHLAKLNHMKIKQSCEKISALNDFIKKTSDHSVHNERYECQRGCQYEHSFTDGQYIRKMFVPAGTIFVTAIHTTEHPLFVMQGRVSVHDGFNKTIVEAPFHQINKVGSQSVIVALEDSLGITVHATDKTNVEDICSELFVDTFDEYNELVEKRDYRNALKEYGLTDEYIHDQMKLLNNENFSEEYQFLSLFPSSLHGTGIKTSRAFNKGDYICPVLVDGVRTPAARYTNHSMFHNSEIVHQEDSMHLYAIENIKIGEELTINYRERFARLKSKGEELCRQQ